jgi:hypothetical protein
MDYIKARPMKILVGIKDHIDVYNYDYNNGDGKAAEIVNNLRKIT